MHNLSLVVTPTTFFQGKPTLWRNKNFDPLKQFFTIYLLLKIRRVHMCIMILQKRNLILFAGSNVYYEDELQYEYLCGSRTV